MIAFDIKTESLEKSCIAKNTVATSFCCFDLIVHAFYKATTKATSKVIDNFVEPIIERYQELAKTGYCTLSDFIPPCK